MSLGVAANQKCDGDDAKAMALVTSPQAPVIAILNVDPESTDGRQRIHDVVKQDDLTLDKAVEMFRSLVTRFENDNNKEAAEQAKLMAEIAQGYCDSSRSIKKFEVLPETTEELQGKLEDNQSALWAIIEALRVQSEDQVTMAVHRFRDTALHFDDESKKRYPILSQAEELFNYTLQRVLHTHLIIKVLAESGLSGDAHCATLVSDECAAISATKESHYDKFFTGVKLTLEVIIERAAKLGADDVAVVDESAVTDDEA